MYLATLPLNALRAFEAAARHLSLTRAADELHVTPSALSHQIRGLEAQLGQQLFVRKVRAIELTAVGKMLYPGLQTGFTHIRDAVDGIQLRADDHVLVVSTPPGFTTKWLAPRLYRFAIAQPDIDARVSSSMANADFRTDGVDLAIRNLRTGQSAGDGLVAEMQMPITLIPVCSPSLIEKFGPIDDVQDINRLPLIHDESFAQYARMPGWRKWLETAGAEHDDFDRGVRLNSVDHALVAAVEGAGVLLTHAVLAHDDLASGRLIQPFDLCLPTDRAYHLVYPEANAPLKKIELFRDWVVAEVTAMTL